MCSDSMVSERRKLLTETHDIKRDLGSPSEDVNDDGLAGKVCLQPFCKLRL